MVVFLFIVFVEFCVRCVPRDCRVPCFCSVHCSCQVMGVCSVRRVLIVCCVPCICGVLSVCCHSLFEDFSVSAACVLFCLQSSVCLHAGHGILCMCLVSSAYPLRVCILCVHMCVCLCVCVCFVCMPSFLCSMNSV